MTNKPLQCYHRFERPGAQSVCQQVHPKFPQYIEKRFAKPRRPLLTKRLRSQFGVRAVGILAACGQGYFAARTVWKWPVRNEHSEDFKV